MSTEQQVTSPEQQKIRLTCPKHGDVSTSSLYLTFKKAPTTEGDKEETQQFLYCLPCLNEVLLNLQKAGTISTLDVSIDTPDDKQLETTPVSPADPDVEKLKAIPGLVSPTETA